MASIIDGTTGSSIAGNATITGNLTVTGSITAGAGAPYVFNAYTSSTTWDATAKKAAGLKSIKVTVVGAGGAGGGSPSTTTNNSGSGGGGGGAAIEYVPVSNITPGPKTVTAGAGTNSFGPWGTATPNSPTATTTATAGANGATSNPAVTATVAGGAGGTGSGGTLTFTGQTGFSVMRGTNQEMSYNVGGNSLLGTGGNTYTGPVTAPTGANGQAGNGYGGGGGGAVNFASPSLTAPAKTGGAGAPGVVIIEEFY